MQGEHARNTRGCQPGGPQSGAEPRHRDGVRRSAVLRGCGHPGKQGRAPGTYGHAMAKGKRQRPQGAPRGEAQQCASPAAPQHASWPPWALQAPSSEPFVEVDSLQSWVFLLDPSLDFRLQAAHGHRAAEGTQIQRMEGEYPLVASVWETTGCHPFPTCTPWGRCPHGPAQTFGSAPLRVRRDVCVHTHSFKPLTARRSKSISQESESTRIPRTPRLHPMPCPMGATHASKVPVLTFSAGTVHSTAGSRTPSCKGKTWREEAGLHKSPAPTQVLTPDQQGCRPELCRVLSQERGKEMPSPSSRPCIWLLKWGKPCPHQCGGTAVLSRSPWQA